MTDGAAPPADGETPGAGAVLVKPLGPLARMAASLGTAVVVLLLGMLLYDSVTRDRESRAWVEHSHLTIDRMRATLSDLKDAEIAPAVDFRARNVLNPR